MKALRSIWQRIAGALTGHRREDDLADEIEFHLRMQTDDYIRAGMSPEEAHRKARLKFGGVESVKEAYRDRRGLPLLEAFARDIRYGLRMLAKSPGFTAVAVVTLALGIGANTAIFTVANTVLLRPLPFPEPDRIVAIQEEIPDFQRYIGRRFPPEVNYVFQRDQLQSFDHLSGFVLASQHLTGVEDPERILNVRTTEDFFTILGAQPLHGRLLEERDLEERARVVVISHSLWMRQFSGDPEIVGQSIRLNEESFTVIGVLPADFRFPWRGLRFDSWSPMSLSRQYMERNPAWGLSYTIARLKNGVSFEQARAELEVLRRRIHPENEAGEGRTLVFRTLHDDLVHSVRQGIVLLLAAVGCVLLISCVNLANLFLGRGLGRRTEMAVRNALGAGRWRIARQVLTESILVAVLGGALGMLVAHWGVRGLAAVSFSRLSLVSDIAIDTDVALYAFALSVLTGLLFGTLPALRLSRSSVSESLKQGGPQETAKRGFKRMQGALVVAEVALSVVLVVGAGLMVNTFIRINRIELGFDPENVLAVSVAPPRSLLRDRDKRLAFQDGITARVRALPGVESAAWTGHLPPSRVYTTHNFRLPGRQYANRDEMPYAYSRSATPGFFKTLRIRPIEGRVFEERDRLHSTRLLVINKAMARRYWPQESAVGKRIILPERRQEVPAEIIGVVENVRTHGLTEGPPDVMYMNPEQTGRFPSSQIVMRTSVEPLSLVPAVKSVIREIDPDQAFRNVTTLEQHYAANQEYAEPRFYTALLGAFGVLALLLASVGLYGVLSFMVSRRSREIGLRMALGARRSTVLGQVMGDGLKLTVLGLAIGVSAAVFSARVLAELLYGISPTDTLTYVCVAAVLMLVSLTACYLPARRATRVDPMTALRHE